MNKKRVCIVGGGISGMSAAWALARHPERYDVMLYEKNDYLGGNAVTDLYIEPRTSGRTVYIATGGGLVVYDGQ